MSGSFTVSKLIPQDAPDEYKEHYVKYTRQEVGNKLFDILLKNKLPAVVDIDEEIVGGHEKLIDGLRYEALDEIRISVTLIDVQHKHITLTAMDRPSFDWRKRGGLFGKLKAMWHYFK